jgi:hypothetical protein
MGCLDPKRPLKVRCKARSRTSGGQCRQPAIPGGTVCFYHGGGSARVRDAAQRRLATLVNPALAVYEAALSPRGRRKDPKAAVVVARDLLDRAGLVPRFPDDPDRVEPSAVPTFSTSVTTTIHVERLTDAQLDEAKRLLEKMGVDPLSVIDVGTSLPAPNQSTPEQSAAALPPATGPEESSHNAGK